MLNRWLERIKSRLSGMMYGRNGNDQFNLFLLIAAVVVMLGNAFVKNTVVHSLLSALTLALIVYVYFRMFSKNVYKRREENRKYLGIRYKVFGYLKGIKERWVQRKDYKFFYCPSCKATLRVPRGHGKIKIVCKKCGNTFMGKS